MKILPLFSVGPKNQSRGKKPFPSFALIMVISGPGVINSKFHVADRCKEVHR